MDGVPRSPASKNAGSDLRNRPPPAVLEITMISVTSGPRRRVVQTGARVFRRWARRREEKGKFHQAKQTCRDFRGCPVRDHDGDGVRDAQDLCPSDPSGASPDPGRPGCPVRDHDGDGIVDDRDLCPTEPVGASPDPRSAGCPLRDFDNDGILNANDVCPDEPAGSTPSPTRRGCPR
jgi:hypothetical protein